MAGYRPLGLSSAAGSTIIAGRATSYADRRRAAAERLSRAEQIAERLDAAVEVPTVRAAPSAPVDPHGTLRASIRALIPLAHRTEGFDVLVSLGPGHDWAARIRRGPEGVTVELVPGPGRAPGSTAGDEPGAASEAAVAAELAAFLWTGGVSTDA